MQAKNEDLILDNAYALGRLKNPELIFRFRSRAGIVASAARDYIRAPGPFNILDLGAAEGSALLELRALLPGGKYVGLEFSENLAFFNRDLPTDTRMIKGDVMNFPEEVKAGRYHIVSAMALLGHLSNPEKAVAEASSALYPGGIFVATCSNPLWEIAAVGLGLLKEESHATRVNKRCLIDAVKRAGLEFLSYKRFMWAPVAALPYLKVPIAPSFSRKIDEIVGHLKVFDWLFVNQFIIARKPQI